MSSSTGATPEGLGLGSGLGHASASASEKHANINNNTQKPRSCVTCRRRKVRCDKFAPCSNCRRANIACVVPSTVDLPPRWARRLDHDHLLLPPRAGHGSQAMQRLSTLEGLVRDLSAQLEHANANAADHSTRDATSARKDVGSLFVRDANASTSRYVSSGFWSRINDELDGLKIALGGDNDDDAAAASEDADSAEKTASSSYRLDHTPSERHAFLFRHNMRAGVHFNEFHPLPSQIPYILNVFAENVNYFLQIVHIPSLSKQVKALRGADLSTLPICTQALLFSIYYAAVTSMEDGDVTVNFGTSKAELGLKYRLGLEHALAQADFLNNPHLALVQAFTIFLALVRRHDSPRYVWMMTGLAIRMAQALGLHRDGSHFPHLTPFEVEVRRRVWWAICSLDLRASEDQGTDITIARSSYDTRLPRNINDADIDVDTKETPPERPGISDSTVAILMYKINDISRRMVTPGTALEEQDALLKDMSEIFDRGYSQYTTEPRDMVAWVGSTSLRLVVAKMTLLVYLPILFASPADRFSDETRNKLLVAAIEVAEYNHALNSEEGCRQWHWIYQTYTHWYAIVYLIIEIIRRPLSPVVERAWLALRSRWLIPANPKLNSSSQVWVPLRKMMAKARQHRGAELDRLRGDAHAVKELEEADRNVPVPGSSGPFTTTAMAPAAAGKSEDLCLEYWRSIVTAPRELGSGDLTQPSELSRDSLPVPTVATTDSFQPQRSLNYASPYPDSNTWTSTPLGSVMIPPGPSQLANSTPGLTPGASTTAQNIPPLEPSLLGGWAHGQTSNPGDQGLPWLWADAEPIGYTYSAPDVNMDVDVDKDIDWVAWMESAKNLESS